jgi:hypothetical protein
MDLQKLNELWDRINRTEDSRDQQNIYILEFCKFLLLGIENYKELDPAQLERDELLDLYIVQMNKITESIGYLYEKLIVQLDQSSDSALFRSKTEALIMRNQEINLSVAEIQEKIELVEKEKKCIDLLSVDLDIVQKGIESIQMYKKQLNIEFLNACTNLTSTIKSVLSNTESVPLQVKPSYSILVKSKGLFRWREKYIVRCDEVIINTIENSITKQKLLFDELSYNHSSLAILLSDGKRYELPLVLIFPDLIGETGNLSFAVKDYQLCLIATAHLKETLDCTLFNINNNPETIIQSLIHYGH